MLNIDLGCGRELSGQRHAPAALPPGKETRCPLYNRLGPVWTGTENLAPHGGSKRGPPNPVSSRYTAYTIPVPIIDVTSTAELAYDVIEGTE